MPRKAAAPADGEPRRSTRIKDQPKPDPPKKAPAKPKAKKADGEAPKRGKKRAAEETNGAEPAAKKVRYVDNATKILLLSVDKTGLYADKNNWWFTSPVVMLG